MKDNLVVSIASGIVLIAGGFTMYNYYVLPAIRHKELINKMNGFEERLKKLEK